MRLSIAAIQCEREISNLQAQPRAVFQRMRGKAAKGAIPTEIRMAIVGQRRDIIPRETREPLRRIVGLQTRVLQPTLVNATKWRPIRATLIQRHRHPKSTNRIAGYRIGSDQSGALQPGSRQQDRSTSEMGQ